MYNLLLVLPSVLPALVRRGLLSMHYLHCRVQGNIDSVVYMHCDRACRLTSVKWIAQGSAAIHNLHLAPEVKLDLGLPQASSTNLLAIAIS